MPACHEEIGNPVNLISGNKYQNVTDFSSAGPQPLRLTRSYNSQAAYHATKISHGRFGRGWRTEYDAKALYFATDPADPQRIHIILPGGREAYSKRPAGSWFRLILTSPPMPGVRRAKMWMSPLP